MSTAAYESVAPSVCSFDARRGIEQRAAKRITATVVVMRFLVLLPNVIMYMGTRMKRAPVKATMKPASLSTRGERILGLNSSA